MGTSRLEYYNNRYKGKLSEQQCDILETLIDLRSMNGSVPDLVHSIYNLPEETVEMLCNEYGMYGRLLTTDYEKPLGVLKDYQTIAVAFMYYAGTGILGDSVGMGKTVEVSGLLNILKREKGTSFRYLMLTEKKTVAQVQHELIRFTGDYAQILPSAEQKVMQSFYDWNPPSERLDYSIVGTHALIKNSTFLAWLKIYADTHGGSPFDILVVDESSILGGSRTEFMKSFNILRKYFKRIIFLNATPFESKLMVFYNQLNLLDNTFLPTKVNFEQEYCIKDYTGMFPKFTGKYKNQKQFKNSVSYRYFASTRKANGAVMEGCGGGIRVSKLSKEQKRLLKETSMPRMVYDCPCSLDSSIEFTEENVPKLQSLKELLENDCKDAVSILVFVHFKEAQTKLSEWLHKQGVSNRILNGDTSYDEGNVIITGFRNNDYRVLITNVQKGLNFGNCDNCIFYSVEPNPSKMIQFEGRMTRTFDIRDKHVYILCSEGKEYKTLTGVVKNRAEAIENMTEVDYSVVLSILLEGDC